MSSANGISITRLPGVGLQVTGEFRVLRVSHGNQHIYWQPSYQAALRAFGPFSVFFPDPSFEESGTLVVFSRHEGAEEILSLTRPIGGREQLPYAEWARFEHAWTQFKLLALRDDVPEEVRDFIKDFTPPSISQFPEAFRIYKPHWYSRPRLLILWGLEPMGGVAFVKPDPQAALAELRTRAPARASLASAHPWILALVIFASLVCALLLLWLALPRPQPDFELRPTMGEAAKVDNRTTFEPGFGGFMFGHCDYDWTFADGFPLFSSEDSPEVTWRSDGKKRVTLEATNSTLWGCLYKSATLEKEVTVVMRPQKSAVLPVRGTHSIGEVDVDRPDLVIVGGGSLVARSDAAAPNGTGATVVSSLPSDPSPKDAGVSKLAAANTSGSPAATGKGSSPVAHEKVTVVVGPNSRPISSPDLTGGQSDKSENLVNVVGSKAEGEMTSSGSNKPYAAGGSPQTKATTDSFGNTEGKADVPVAQAGPDGTRKKAGEPDAPLPVASPSKPMREARPGEVDLKGDPDGVLAVPSKVMEQPGTPTKAPMVSSGIKDGKPDVPVAQGGSGETRKKVGDPDAPLPVTSPSRPMREAKQGEVDLKGDPDAVLAVPAKVMEQPGTPLGPIQTKARPGAADKKSPQITFEVVRQELDANSKELHTIGMKFYAPRGVRITRVYVDDLAVSEADFFNRVLSIGEHVIQVDYESASADGPMIGNVRKTLNLGNQVKPEFKISDKTTTTQR